MADAAVSNPPAGASLPTTTVSTPIQAPAAVSDLTTPITYRGLAHRPIATPAGVVNISQARPATAVMPNQALSMPPSPAVATSQPSKGNQAAPLPRRRVTALDMDLPGEASPLRVVDDIVRRGKWYHVRLWAFRGMAMAVVLVIIAGGLLFSQGAFKLRKVFRGGTATAAALQENVNPELLKGEGSGRVNVLLLGRGGGNHDAPDLTDTMMLASIDPINHAATLFSIPRDLWVNIPNHGSMKINAAWQTGEFAYLGKTITGSTNHNAIAAGFDEVDQVVEDVLGINVDYNMLVNFQAFKQAIDTVNGVEVNVPADLVDPTMAWENANNPILAHAGNQVMNGKNALLYVRSRETTSDFARSLRQRSVLMALKSKVDTLGTLSNPMKLSGLVSAFGNNVDTDLSIKNATRLYRILRGIDQSNIGSIGLADAPNQYVTTGNVNGQSIVLPKTGLYNYGDIQSFVRSQLKDPYIIKEKARITVLNGTTVSGQATAKAAELQKYGYNVISTGNAPTTGWTQTTLVDLSHGKAKYTAHYLEGHFKVKPVKELPDKAIQTNGADFVIIVGSDEVTTPQN